jgi:hypothetical protein
VQTVTGLKDMKIGSIPNLDTRLKSLTESITNILAGWPINHASNIIILLPLSQHLADVVQTTGAFSLETQLTLGLIGLAYTFISVVRQYFLRRLFERFGNNENGYTLMLRLYRKIKNA